MTKPLILIVDDNSTNVQVLASLISTRNYDVAAATSGDKALRFISRKLPDLILLDIKMPDFNGYEVCKELKKNPRTSHVPIMFISGIIDEESIVKGFEMGAVDYITKPIRTLELLARIDTHVQLKLAKEKLYNLSIYDPLTNVFNRRYFIDKLGELTGNTVYNLIMIDIDEFKTINDTYGHDVGDIYLKDSVAVISSLLNDNSSLCRIGGDELVIICEDDSSDNVKLLAEKICYDIANFSLKDYPHVSTTVSIGIASSKNITSVNDVLKNVDIALYNAKEKGKNQVAVNNTSK